jgi:hypothetical protein
MLPSSGMHHLIIVSWWRLTIYSPINHYGIASLSHKFTCPLSPNGQQASSIWNSQDAYLELTLLNLNGEHPSVSFSCGLYKSFFWCNPMERYLTLHSNATHIDHVLVYKALFSKLTIPLDHLIQCDTSFMLRALTNLNPLFTLHLHQPCIFSCFIKYLLRYIKNSSFDCML